MQASNCGYYFDNFTNQYAISITENIGYPSVKK